ncbi:lipid asymmetry ABC transporter MlaABCDEF, lipoprotein MlaA [Malaciobacter marinus]|uniref:Lipid asymmetry ABC transporter MlaABCDEF, lipoprotein MlaA n=2 Tax=Malaciobacter marinus TaxID=505249 RepID=A0A347TJQ4_9BACT|nr:VacJ family lipoprotein [Malaciobacter marinus]AXX86832.1 lipid asymmetry ABC transporter MlaABCDEF, lipoprotein MlaA [Malaciobacter marinus]
MKKVVLILMLSLLYSCNAKQIEQTNNLATDETYMAFDDISSEFENKGYKKDEFDPLSGYNRAMTSFNDSFYLYISKPVILTYKDIVHPTIRTGVSNFFTNLGFPIRFINNLLQFKFQNSWEELQMFLLNTTFGIAGLIDVAKENNFEIKHHDEDFGQTLATWGVGEGFHIVLPILGPSNLRDTFAFFVDDFANPLKKGDTSFYLSNSTEESIGIRTFKVVNNSSFKVEVYDKIRKDAIDLYPYLKDFHRKQREKQIKE